MSTKSKDTSALKNFNNRSSGLENYLKRFCEFIPLPDVISNSKF